jgi:predicted  nucleic acid-binding Zn-ribbon protein
MSCENLQEDGISGIMEAKEQMEHNKKMSDIVERLDKLEKAIKELQEKIKLLEYKIESHSHPDYIPLSERRM